MRTKLFGLAIMAVLSGNGFAGENSGVRGGGHVVEVNGKLELVDIVTSARCDWFSGQEMRNQSQAVNKVLKNIEKLDWYLALELKREIEYISWCMTGNLYSVPAGDADSFVQQLTKGVQQAAFRYNGNAYIDQSKYSRLSNNSQAYLVFHEMLHSYLPMNLEMRIFKLQSLVSTIQKVDLGQITTRESLHFNLSKNEMDFPLTVSKLEPYKKSLQFIFSSLAERTESILATKEPEKLIHSKITDSLPFVADWDKQAVLKANKSITDALLEIFRGQELSVVKFVLNEQIYKQINPAAAALSIYDELSEEVQKEIMSSPYFSKIIKEGADYLDGIQFSIVNGRIVGDLALQSLSGQCLELSALHTTSLIVQNESCQLPVKIKAITDIMVRLAETENDQTLEEQLERNDRLIQALRMKKALEAIEVLNPAIAREKTLALNIVQNIQAELVKTIIKDVTQRVSKPSAALERIFKKLQ